MPKKWCPKHGRFEPTEDRVTCPECGRTGQITQPKNDRDAWKGKLTGTGDGPRLPTNPPQRLSDDPKLMEAMERRDGSLLLTDGGHEFLDDLKRRSVEQRERLRQLLRGRHGRHGVPYRVGRVCACCEAPRAFTYVRDRPITTTTGAWGKYVEPVYRCRTCRTLHSGGFNEWGPVVPEASP